MKGLFRVLVLVMIASMYSGLAAPSASALTAQTDTSGPVGMVSGPWRMMAWQFAFAPEFPEQGLEAREGSNWGILVADMTNTGVDGGLSVVDVSLGDGEVPGDVAQSVAVSQLLGFTGLGADGELPVAENGISRIAVVMNVPEGVGYPAIRIGDEVVSVESVMTETLDLADLPQAATAMQLETGRILAIFSTTRWEIAMDSGAFTEYEVDGLYPPPAGNCHSDPSKTTLASLELYVWIETVPGIDAPTFWLNDPETLTFQLLDQRLVEEGLAQVYPAARADASVYASWLTSFEEEAVAAERGLHGPCPDVGAVPTSDPVAAPPTTAPPVAAAPSQQQLGVGTQLMATIDANPYAYIGDTVTVTGLTLFGEVRGDNTFFLLINEYQGQPLLFVVGVTGIHSVPDSAVVAVTGIIDQPVEDPLQGGLAPTLLGFDLEVVGLP